MSRWQSEEEMLQYFTRGGSTPIEYLIVWGGRIFEWVPDLALLLDSHDSTDAKDGAFTQYLSERGWSYRKGAEINEHADRYNWPDWVPLRKDAVFSDDPSEENGVPY